MAIHAASRMLGLAQPGETLVSETIAVLARDAGMAFEDRGTHELRGLQGARHLFAARAGKGRLRRRSQRTQLVTADVGLCQALGELGWIVAPEVLVAVTSGCRVAEPRPPGKRVSVQLVRRD